LRAAHFGQCAAKSQIGLSQSHSRGTSRAASANKFNSMNRYAGRNLIDPDPSKQACAVLLCAQRLPACIPLSASMASFGEIGREPRCADSQMLQDVFRT